jgi:hypothetical protein
VIVPVAFTEEAAKILRYLGIAGTLGTPGMLQT